MWKLSEIFFSFRFIEVTHSQKFASLASSNKNQSFAIYNEIAALLAIIVKVLCEDKLLFRYLFQ